MRRNPLVLFAAAFLIPLHLTALEVRFHPGQVVYTYEVDPARGLSTIVLQNIAVVRKDGPPVTIESLEIQALFDGQPVQTMTVPAVVLEQTARQMSSMEAAGILKLYDFHFQTSRYLDGLRMSPDRTLAPGTALVVSGQPLLLGLPVQEVAVLARGKDDSGKAVEARGSLKVAEHQSPNEYHLPLAGTWYVAVAPNLHAPHRWVANQEFGIDFAALGGDGKTHKGTGSRLDEYYGYGRDVLAVADGVVVDVILDGTEANDRLRQQGESIADFEKRTGMAQNALLAKSIRAPLGNYVCIRHGGGEHSHYAHLKEGSVRVKAGDTVKRGQVLGQLGHTGNSTEPHLHFQLTDGPDPMYSRGLPVVFRNVVVEGFGWEDRPLQSGWIVTTR